MDLKQHRWRKRRHPEDGDFLALLPEWLTSGFRKRPGKMRMRLMISMASCLFLVYLAFFTSQNSDSDNSITTQEINVRQRTARSQWRISSKSRLKPVSIDTIDDSQAHAPKKVNSKLMGPSPEGVKLAGRHAPPGYMGVGGEMDLKPPPGPSLQLDRPPGPSDHMNPRMRIIDSTGQGKGSKNVGPPGLSNALHLVEGEAYPQLAPATGVLAPPNSLAVLNSHNSDIQVELGKTLPKIVYLDFRVGPPKLSFLEDLIPWLSRSGVSGVLIDYQDNFPYVGELTPLASKTAYSVADIKKLVNLAQGNKLEIMPLVQVFSNTEFILKHIEFQNLQERQGFMQNLNPLKNATKRLLADMISQVLQAHPGTKNIHLGCGEIFHLGFSKETKSFMESSHYSKSYEVFLQHVSSMARLVKAQHSGIDVIIWDTVLRNIPESSLKRSEVGGLVMPMIKMKTFDVKFPAEVLSKFAKIFSSVWITSTFNRPFNSIASLPSPLKYTEHQKAWLNKIKTINSMIKIKGIVLKGTFKTTYFSPVGPVLLPMALPTLQMSLATLNFGNFNQSVLNYVTSTLECPQVGPYQEGRIWEMFSSCKFPGHSLYFDFVVIRRNVLKMRQIINSRDQNDISPIVRSFEELLPDLPRHLVKIYSQHLSREWIDGHLLNNLTPLGGFKTKAKSVLVKNKWLTSPNITKR